MLNIPVVNRDPDLHVRACSHAPQLDVSIQIELGNTWRVVRLPRPLLRSNSGNPLGLQQPALFSTGDKVV